MRVVDMHYNSASLEQGDDDVTMRQPEYQKY